MRHHVITRNAIRLSQRVNNRFNPKRPIHFHLTPRSSIPIRTLTSKSTKNEIIVTKTSASQSPPPTPPEDTAKEKEDKLHHLQNEIRLHFHNADYSRALASSETSLALSLSHFGKRHPVTASSYNNVGLMNKMLGNFSDARENYHSALRIYGDTVGKDHESYAAALNNLGNLDRFEARHDESLTGLDRMRLVDSAVEYFEEALRIREAELGEEHPYAVASRSHLGGALAAQLLESSSSKEEGKKVLRSVGKFTVERWGRAEEHLRGALLTAVKNPRGQKVTRGNEGGNDDGNTMPEAQTYSAAGAAQNLAVFLKMKGDVVSGGAFRKMAERMELDAGDLYGEAKGLYESALYVRNELCGSGHPETIATKFSLAELYEAIGDSSKADELRKEIMDDYEVDEVDAEEHESSKRG